MIFIKTFGSTGVRYILWHIKAIYRRADDTGTFWFTDIRATVREDGQVLKSNDANYTEFDIEHKEVSRYKYVVQRSKLTYTEYLGTERWPYRSFTYATVQN